MAYTLNGVTINIDAPYTAPNGTRYPNLRSPEIRAMLGVTEVPDDPQFDQRFYWGVGNPKLLDDREEVDEQGNPMWVQAYDPVTEQMVNTDKRLVTKGLKSQWIAQTKDTAGKMLAQTDWYITRSVEGVKPVDAETTAARAAIRAYSDSLEAAIAGAATVEALIEVLNSQDWPK